MGGCVGFEIYFVLQILAWGTALRFYWPLHREWTRAIAATRYLSPSIDRDGDCGDGSLAAQVNN